MGSLCLALYRRIRGAGEGGLFHSQQGEGEGGGLGKKLHTIFGHLSPKRAVSLEANGLPAVHPAGPGSCVDMDSFGQTLHIWFCLPRHLHLPATDRQHTSRIQFQKTRKLGF